LALRKERGWKIKGKETGMGEVVSERRKKH
jgi:hypothetical protein